MRLISVTVRNYRVHKELSVAFDAHRTVIGGPNEAGKSTLVEAVHHALFLRSRVTGAVQKAMLSELHAGHPSVELQFESGGTRYTLTKIFSGNPSASTTLREQPAGGDAAGGRTLRDDEAESRIHEILRAENVGGGRNVENRIRMQWAHLWTWQGAATEDPLSHANSERHAELLRERLSRVEGGGVLESPLDAAAAREIAARQAATFTDKGRPRADSALESAARGLEAAEAACARAADAVASLEGAVDEIDAAERTIAMCDAKLQHARDEMEAVRVRQQEAAALGVQIAEEQAAAAAAEAAHAEAVRADTEIVACLAEIAAIETRLGPALDSLHHLESEETEASIGCDEATRRMIAAVRRQGDAAGAFALRDVLEKHARLLVEREGLGGRCTRIAEQRLRARNIEADLAKLPSITAVEMAEIASLERQREAADATLGAIATRLEVISAGRPVQLAGVDLAVGTPVTIAAAADLVIGGDPTTTVRISPGGGKSLAEATRRLGESAAALEAALAAVGGGSTTAVRESFARRQSLEADLHAVNLAIEGLGGGQAEADLAALDAEIERVAAEIRRRTSSEPVTTGEKGQGAAEGLATARAELARAEGELHEASEAAATANLDVAAAKARLQSIAARRAEATLSMRSSRLELDGLKAKASVLEERHGVDRSPRIALLDDARRKAVARVAASRARMSRLGPEALELDRARLERSLANLAASKQDAETRRQLARARLELEGTTDPREDLATAAARRRIAAGEHALAVREAEAVKLLATLFGEKKREVEARFVAPLTTRVGGYLERLFGEGTAVGVDYENGRFSRLTLARRGLGNATFEFSQLSAGAREQTAAAFRLAMAEVLAEDHGGCLPVVFDDAFVNSDADRQTALQRILDLAAARGLQVIILSCRPEAYVMLGGVNVTLGPAAG